LRARALKSFCYAQSEPMSCRILREDCNQIFPPVQWRYFLSKDNICALQSRLINSFLIYIFLVLIVWYNALLIHVLSIKVILLLLFCYLIQDLAFFFLFISFLSFFNLTMMLLRIMLLCTYSLGGSNLWVFFLWTKVIDYGFCFVYKSFKNK